jgi:hypothetical protein
MFSAVLVEWGNACEFGYLLAVCLSEFGKLGHENAGSCFRHAWDRAKEFFFLTPEWAVFDSFLNLALGFCETLFQEG